jgi:uncharacterized protein
MLKPLCIYHGNCADGFTAAWAVWCALGPGRVDFVPGIYGAPPPDVTGRDVIMVDFSYKRPVLDGMAQHARSMLILDHHKTAQADLAGFGVDITHSSGPFGWQRHMANIQQDEYEGVPHSIYVEFDMTRSGAQIAWDFFHSSPRPTLVDYVADRDLWRFALPDSRAVSAALFSHSYNLENWNHLAQIIAEPTTRASFILQGKAIERKHHKDVAELVRVTRRDMVIGGARVPVANVPYTMASDAGALMAKDAPFAACYYDRPDARVFSLRSADTGADVAAIAASYGGGGHQHAAGFQAAPGWEGDE